MGHPWNRAWHAARSECQLPVAWMLGSSPESWEVLGPGPLRRKCSPRPLPELPPTRQPREGQNHLLWVAAILMTSKRSYFPT